mmetsp:Transcript_37535/g.33604  ORF Transcript_37535/g.33604 Transcript_37535/m.33604 type:complete len:128 (+) Transcript_37535:1532-1915(+)
MLAFGLMATFYYGDSMLVFTNFGWAILYFVTILHENYEGVQDMYESDPVFTLFFMIAVIFVINFILASMFLIYVVHSYLDHFKEKAKGQDPDSEYTTNQYEFSPHPVWTFWYYMKIQFPLKFYRVFN